MLHGVCNLASLRGTQALQHLEATESELLKEGYNFFVSLSSSTIIDAARTILTLQIVPAITPKYDNFWCIIGYHTSETLQMIHVLGAGSR